MYLGGLTSLGAPDRIQKNSVKGFLIYFTTAVVKSNCFLIRVVSKLQWNLHLTNLYITKFLV